MKKCIIYGAGDIGKNYFKKINQLYQVVAYCDSNSAKWGSMINDCLVIPKTEIKEYVIQNEIEVVVVAIFDISVKDAVVVELSNHLKENQNVQVLGYQEVFFYHNPDWKKLIDILMDCPHTGLVVEENKYEVAFFESVFAYFVEAGKPLIEEYLSKNEKCILIWPKIDEVEWAFAGEDNLRKILGVIDAFSKKGVCSISISNPAFNNCRIKYCFGMGYDNTIPNGIESLKDSKRIMIQTVPMRTHLYDVNLTNGITKEKECGFAEGMDYYIGSAYSCDYMETVNESWKPKVFRLGYPRMDQLYGCIHEKTQCPSEWLDYIEGKKVFFSTVVDPVELLPLFPKGSMRVLLWRPHPLKYQFTDYMELIKTYEKEYSVILDFEPNYYTASAVSDALISNVQVSLNLNYLYYQKPILLVRTEQQTGDYEIQAWYKAMYHAETTEEIERFIQMVERGEDTERDKLKPYRDYMTQHFDGKVCERIYDFLKGIEE